MNNRLIFSHSWTRYVVAVLLVFFAAVSRIWPLHALGSTLAWLTFYPTVMVVAIYGGLYVGFLTIALSCFTVTSMWPLLVNEPFIKIPADYLGMSVFILTCSMIVGVAEALRRAYAREERYHTLFASMDEGFCVVEMIYDPNGKPVDYRFVEINPAFEKHTGLKQAQGKTICQMVPDHDAHWLEIYGKVAQTGEAIRFENPAIAMQRYYDVFAFRIDENGNKRVGIIFNDISERKQAEKLLRESEERYHSLFENMLDGFSYCKLLFDGDTARDFIYIDVNNAFEKLTGLKNVIGKKVTDVIPGIRESNPNIFEIYGRVALTGKPERFETYVGQLGIWLFLTVYSLEKEYFVAVFENISERKKSEKQLQLAASVYNNITEGVLTTQPDGTIDSVNPAFCHITGYSEAELIGSNPRILKSSRQDSIFYQVMWNSISHDGYWQGEIWNRRKDGTLYLARETITAIRNNQGQLQNYVAVQSDITELKKIEENIRHQAYHDQLTKLPNRVLFMDRLRHQIAYSHRQKSCMAVLFIDLDGFKAVNDSLGHEAGDDLLKQVAIRLKECVRESDTVARLGGDEFTAVISDITGVDDAAAVAQKMLEMMCKPFNLGVNEGTISASIGISLYPTNSDNAAKLLKGADEAMYVAKRSGKAKFAFVPMRESL